MATTLGSCRFPQPTSSVRNRMANGPRRKFSTPRLRRTTPSVPNLQKSSQEFHSFPPDCWSFITFGAFNSPKQAAHNLNTIPTWGTIPVLQLASLKNQSRIPATTGSSEKIDRCKYDRSHCFHGLLF